MYHSSDIEYGFADLASAKGKGGADAGQAGEEDRKRSSAKLDLGYDTEDHDGDLRNAVSVHGAMAKAYLGGNGSGGLKRVILDTVERLRDSAKDLVFYSEPCQLSNF